MARIQTAFFPLQGGLNLVTPPISTPPGHAISGLNYEPDVRGYARTQGHERYDGRPKPSAQSYWVLRFDQGTDDISEATVVTGATSGATGLTAFGITVETGAFGDGDAAGYMVLTQVTGTFQDNENLQVSAATKCVADGTADEAAAPDDETDAMWRQIVIENARGLIAEVPGSGPVRGGFVYNGDVYAFRDNPIATAGALYKATSSGWALQALGSTLLFDASVGEIFEGDTVVGATSAASGVVKRVALLTGAWGTAGTGALVFASVTGTFQNNENLQVSSVTKAVANGTLTANTLPAGGRYECVGHNFYGAADRRRVYGVNGVGKAFDYDGTCLAFITTGMAADTPKHIAVFKQQLMLAFPGGSLQYSTAGEPHEWDAITGAGEIGLGEEITALMPDVQGAFVIFGKNNVAVLYGNDSTDFSLSVLNSAAGCVEWTAQMIGTPYYLDDGGIRTLNATQAFGDFRMGSATQLISTIFRSKRAAGITAVASMQVRGRDQYRLFWSDGSGLCIYLGRKNPEALPFDYGVVATCCWAGEDDNGNEILFMGDGDGLVYQLESGTSFDGSEVNATIRFAFNNIGSPQQNKRFLNASMDVDAAPNTRLGMTAEFAYGDPNQPASQELLLTVSGSGGFWNEAFWDQFYWSSPVAGKAVKDIDGLGQNISIAVVSSETYRPPHTLTGMTLFFTYRGLAR
jgi:hypothetical protein